MGTTPTADEMARDLAKDLAAQKNAPFGLVLPDGGGNYTFTAPEVFWLNAARAGWPAAIRRALAAEALLRRACTATGPDGYAELTAALDEARALLGLPRPCAGKE